MCTHKHTLFRIKRIHLPCNNPMPTSGFSRTTAGLSRAELTNAENSRLAPAMIDRSVIVAILITTNSGKRYAGRVDEVTGSLNDSRHGQGMRCRRRRRRLELELSSLPFVRRLSSDISGDRGDAAGGDKGEFIIC